MKDLQILIQEKDTLLAEKEESARLAHSMENIARKELESSEEHILLLQSRIKNLEISLRMSAVEYEGSIATICEQEATILELDARHLETTKNHNNAMKQVEALQIQNSNLSMEIKRLMKEELKLDALEPLYAKQLQRFVSQQLESIKSFINIFSKDSTDRIWYFLIDEGAD